METPDRNRPSSEGPGTLTRDELRKLLPSLTRALRRRGLSPQEVEDMAQEILCSAWEKQHRFRGESKLSTWVHGIAKNKWLQWNRDQRRQKRSGIEVGLADQAEEPTVGAVLETPDAGPEERLLAQERYRLVLDTIDTLPPEMRDALVLHVHQGRSYKEIAALLRCDVNRVSSLIFQARQKLRRADPQTASEREVRHA